jgi:predicted MFS family arabinose efflux permease
MVAVRPPGVLRRHRDLRLLWAGAAVSFAGDAVSRLALPLVAVITLRASPAQVGVLVAASTIGWLLLALPAGAWVDRTRRRPVLVATNTLAAVATAVVPVAWALGVLSAWQLYAVALVTGCLAVTTNLASFAIVPSLVPADDLPGANAALSGSASVAAVAGPSLGGALVQLLGAPVAVSADAASFAVCAGAVLALRTREPRLDPPAAAVRADIVAGLRHTFGTRLLRAVALTGGFANLMVNAFTAVAVLFLVRVLRLSPGLIGVLLAVTGTGGVVGAVVAPRVIRSIGLRRALWLPLSTTGLVTLVMPLSSRGAGLLLFALGGFCSTFGGVVYNVAVATYVQSVTPARMLGRTMASIRLVSRGALAFGGLLGGGVATWLSLRDAMWFVCAGLAVSSSPIVWSARVRADALSR